MQFICRGPHNLPGNTVGHWKTGTLLELNQQMGYGFEVFSPLSADAVQARVNEGNIFLFFFGIF
jgi:hypothetical protein